MFIESSRGKRGRAGYTLIELLVVCAIIGILAVLMLANVKRAIRKAREARTYARLSNIRLQLDMHKVRFGYYPERIIYNSFLSAWTDPYEFVSWVHGSAASSGLPGQTDARPTFGSDARYALPVAEVSATGEEIFAVAPHYFSCGTWQSVCSPANVWTLTPGPTGNNRGWWYRWVQGDRYGHMAQDNLKINNTSFSTEGQRYSTY